MRAALWSAVLLGLFVPGIVLAEEKAEPNASAEAQAAPVAQPESAAP